MPIHPLGIDLSALALTPRVETVCPDISTLHFQPLGHEPSAGGLDLSGSSHTQNLWGVQSHGGAAHGGHNTHAPTSSSGSWNHGGHNTQGSGQSSVGGRGGHVAPSSHGGHSSSGSWAPKGGHTAQGGSSSSGSYSSHGGNAHGGQSSSGSFSGSGGHSAHGGNSSSGSFTGSGGQSSHGGNSSSGSFTGSGGKSSSGSFSSSGGNSANGQSFSGSHAANGQSFSGSSNGGTSTGNFAGSSGNSSSHTGGTGNGQSFFGSSSGSNSSGNFTGIGGSSSGSGASGANSGGGGSNSGFFGVFNGSSGANSSGAGGTGAGSHAAGGHAFGGNGGGGHSTGSHNAGSHNAVGNGASSNSGAGSGSKFAGLGWGPDQQAAYDAMGGRVDPPVNLHTHPGHTAAHIHPKHPHMVSHGNGLVQVHSLSEQSQPIAISPNLYSVAGGGQGSGGGQGLGGEPGSGSGRGPIKAQVGLVGVAPSTTFMQGCSVHIVMVQRQETEAKDARGTQEIWDDQQRKRETFGMLSFLDQEAQSELVAQQASGLSKASPSKFSRWFSAFRSLPGRAEHELYALQDALAHQRAYMKNRVKLCVSSQQYLFVESGRKNEPAVGRVQTPGEYEEDQATRIALWEDEGNSLWEGEDSLVLGSGRDAPADRQRRTRQLATKIVFIPEMGLDEAEMVHVYGQSKSVASSDPNSSRHCLRIKQAGATGVAPSPGHYTMSACAVMLGLYEASRESLQKPMLADWSEDFQTFSEQAAMSVSPLSGHIVATQVFGFATTPLPAEHEFVTM